MENGTISDSKISASSVQSPSTPAKNGRLNYTSGSSWCAKASDSNSYLQIDLQTLHIICAVSTQGNSQADQWVKTYTLKLSKDGLSSSWTDYKEDRQVKVCSNHSVGNFYLIFFGFYQNVHVCNVISNCLNFPATVSNTFLTARVVAKNMVSELITVFHERHGKNFRPQSFAAP